MRKIVNENLVFIIPYLLFLSAGILLMLLVDKESLHLLSNRYHSPFFDCFFSLITHLGDGITATLIGIGLLLYSLKNGLYLLASVLSSGLLVQGLKQFVFADAQRPLRALGEEGLHLIEHVQVHLYHSFPSGHTTTAFALFFSISIMSKSKAIKLLSFALALLAGYSRIYLNQHFASDVLAGSFIGLFFASCCSFIYYSQKEWLTVSPYTIIKNRKGPNQNNV